MNLNLDMSIITRALHALVSELRQKRLWPVAAVLVAAMIAVPVLLSKSPKPAAQAEVPAPVAPPPSGTALPAISVQPPVHTNLTGHARNPFAAAAGSGPSGLITSATGNAVSSVASAAQNAVNTVTGGGGVPSSPTTTGSVPSGSSSTTTPSSTPTSTPSITGNAKPKPIHTGLTSTQAYAVSISITSSNGGVDSIAPVRLSGLPSDQQPDVTEYGVLQGGRRVLFALHPGTQVSGPGTCIPGILDCEILSLGQDQTEAISTDGPNGLNQVALFAVTGINVTNYSSAAAASKARHEASASGRAWLSQTSLPTLSLFKYEPSLGSVVDLRNLTVGS